MTIWYTSDSHFDHLNIIKYCQRPFTSVEEMNETMIEQWNMVVRPQDHVWHLGDLTMHRKIHTIKYRILDRLNGHKRLLLGNHDLDSMQHYLEFFEKIQASHIYDEMLFTHIPVHLSSLGRFKANVHGHTHTQIYPPATRYTYVNGVEDQTRPYQTPYLNVCVEQTGYRPISLDEIHQRVKETHDQ